jgi:hypothetical protein
MKKLFLLLFAVLLSCKGEHAPAAVSAPQRLDTPKNAATGTQAADLKSLGYVAPGATVSSPGLAADAAAPPPPPGSAPPAQRMPRMIVRNAEVRLIVSDAGAAIRSLTAAAEAVGGYVGDAKTWREGEQLRGTLTLRVPAARLTGVLESARKLAVRVESESVTSDDVSQEYVDLASALRNEEAAENELRALMTDVRQRTKRASDVIEMYQQLAMIRGEVEKTKGRMQFLEQTSALSTIKVELIPDAIAKPVVEPGWQPLVIVKDAGRALVGTLEWLTSVLIWFGLYVLPLLLLFILPIVLVVKVLRRRGRRVVSG